jgi:hypothetical protein
VDSVDVQLDTASRGKLFPALGAVEEQLFLGVHFASVGEAFLLGVERLVAFAAGKNT